MSQLKSYSVITLVLFCLLSFSSYAKTVISICDQASFDCLTDNLVNVINSGAKDIYVSFTPGIYTAKEKHLEFINIIAPYTKLHIVGNSATIIPAGNEYKEGESFLGQFDPDHCWMSASKDIDIWSNVRYSDSLVEILDKDKKRCRIKATEEIGDNPAPISAFILIPHWFKSSTYRIEKVKDRYIYFTAPDLAISYNNGYNLNDDFNVGKNKIRYIICNLDNSGDNLSIINKRIKLPFTISSVREGETTCFMAFENCCFASIEVTGFYFYGNSSKMNKSYIYLANVDANGIRIHSNFFHGMRGDVVSISSTDNVRIDENEFVDCYRNGILSDNASQNTDVRRNSFANMGLGLSNTFCIICRGNNYSIVENKMINYGYGGIGVGVWYKSIQRAASCGVVEKNDLSYTDDYLSELDNHTIMDGGAIYVWTKNDGATIRYNYIHNYSGIGGNRGIFCDDGAYNIQIYGNVITGIDNSYCIESRRVASVEKTTIRESSIERSNINVIIRDNIIDGEIVFAGNEGHNNGCVKGTNFILIKDGASVPRNRIANVTNVQEDIVLEYTGETKGRIGLTAKSYRKLKRTKMWHLVRNCFKRQSK